MRTLFQNDLNDYEGKGTGIGGADPPLPLKNRFIGVLLGEWYFSRDPQKSIFRVFFAPKSKLMIYLFIAMINEGFLSRRILRGITQINPDRQLSPDRPNKNRIIGINVAYKKGSVCTSERFFFLCVQFRSNC